MAGPWRRITSCGWWTHFLFRPDRPRPASLSCSPKSCRTPPIRPGRSWSRHRAGVLANGLRRGDPFGPLALWPFGSVPPCRGESQTNLKDAVDRKADGPELGACTSQQENGAGDWGDAKSGEMRGQDRKRRQGRDKDWNAGQRVVWPDRQHNKDCHPLFTLPVAMPMRRHPSASRKRYFERIEEVVLMIGYHRPGVIAADLQFFAVCQAETRFLLFPVPLFGLRGLPTIAH